VKTSDILEEVARSLSALTKGDMLQLEIHGGTSLLHDLKLISLLLVDLILAVEDEFLIDEFPLQDRIDAEQGKGERGFSCARACPQTARASVNLPDKPHHRSASCPSRPPPFSPTHRPISARQP